MYIEMMVKIGLLNKLQGIIMSDLGEDLHKGQFPVLLFVEKNSGCTQVELANGLRVSPASVAVSTKRLEKAGFLKREQDESNMRCNRLYLTEKAQIMMDDGKKRMRWFEHEAFSKLSAEEFKALNELFDKVLFNLTDVNISSEQGRSGKCKAIKSFSQKVRGIK